MADHYFTNAPSSTHDVRNVSVQLGNRCLVFETDAGTFSREHLDPGSRLIIDTIPPISGRLADIGCGWGPIGTSLAIKNPHLSVEMVDVNQRAVALAQKNAQANGASNAAAYVSDALQEVAPGLDVCVTNPPIRAGKAVIYGFFAQAHEKLVPGGKLYIVIRKQQGAPSAVKYLLTLYGEVNILAKSAGYWILEAVKQANAPC